MKFRKAPGADEIAAEVLATGGEAAFDTVWRKALWKMMRAIGVEGKIVNIIEEMYKNTQCAVIINRQITSWFQLHDNLSTEERYADDTTLIAAIFRKLQISTTELESACKKWGLKVNAAKCKVITSEETDNIMIEDTAVEKVPEFVFLGSVVPGTTSDIKRRIALAASAFGRLRKTVWNRRDISKNLKVRLFQALILPIATYACETWTLKKSDELLLLSFEMRCLRVILCITLRDRIPNAEIRSRLGAEQTITDRIRTRRLRWFGHVMRRPTNTLVYKAYHQDFQNPRPRGRPPKRWKDQIQSDTGITLSVAEAIALDRTGWRNLTEGSKGPVPGLGT
ncbi:hypothetical protein Bbelb_331600 [Branchiostoma belcheri]|nr:hypothetical protein Bbelb_331600 [Branchiostoma belcheri]